jgi:hypothetical protein
MSSSTCGATRHSHDRAHLFERGRREFYTDSKTNTDKPGKKVPLAVVYTPWPR